MNQTVATNRTNLKTEELAPVSGLPLIPVLVIFGILLIIFFGILGWAVFNHQKLVSRQTSEHQSPNCITTVCVDGTKKVEIQLDPTANPNTAEYETMNHCTSSAPPTSFLSALQQCADSSQNIPMGLTSDKVSAFATFYNKNYIDTCGYNWRTRPTNIFQPLQPQGGSQKLPFVDPTLVNLIPCAARLNVTGSDIDALRTKCGPSCASM